MCLASCSSRTLGRFVFSHRAITHNRTLTLLCALKAWACRILQRTEAKEQLSNNSLHYCMCLPNFPADSLYVQDDTHMEHRLLGRNTHVMRVQVWSFLWVYKRKWAAEQKKKKETELTWEPFQEVWVCCWKGPIWHGFHEHPCQPQLCIKSVSSSLPLSGSHLKVHWAEFFSFSADNVNYFFFVNKKKQASDEGKAY